MYSGKCHSIHEALPVQKHGMIKVFQVPDLLGNEQMHEDSTSLFWNNGACKRFWSISFLQNKLSVCGRPWKCTGHLLEGSPQIAMMGLQQKKLTGLNTGTELLWSQTDILNSCPCRAQLFWIHCWHHHYQGCLMSGFQIRMFINDMLLLNNYWLTAGCDFSKWLI